MPYLLWGFELVKSSIEKLIHPEPVESSPVIIGILAVSILVKVYMFYYNRAVGKKIESAAMKATAMDSLSDTVSTALVLAATVISQLQDFFWMDGLVFWWDCLFCIQGPLHKGTMDLLLGSRQRKNLLKRSEILLLLINWYMESMT